MNDQLQHCKSATYADDTTIYVVIEPNPESIEAAAVNINADLSRLMEWSNKWKITFEPTKSHSVLISTLRSLKRQHLPIFLGPDSPALSAESSFTQLGILFDDKLLFDQHITQMARIAGFRLNTISRLSRILSQSDSVKMYKAFIRSQLEYGSIIWMSANKSHLKLLDNIQSRAMRIIGIEKSLWSSYNILPLDHRRQVTALATIYRMFLKSCPTLLKSKLPELSSISNSNPTRTTRSTSKPHHLYHLNVASLLNSKNDVRNNGNKKLDNDQYKRVFLYASSIVWNDLPSDVIGPIDSDATPPQDASSLSTFKKRASHHLLNRDPEELLS